MRKPRRAGLTLLIALCSACGSGPYVIPAPASDTRAGDVTNDSLTLRAAVVSQNEPYNLMRVEVTALNKLNRPVFLQVPGGCPVAIQVLSAPPPTGQVVWDSHYARSSLGCVLSVVQRRIDPGESKVFSREIARGDVLGDSLAAGRYYVRAMLDLDPRAISVDAGEVSLSK